MMLRLACLLVVASACAGTPLGPPRCVHEDLACPPDTTPDCRTTGDDGHCRCDCRPVYLSNAPGPGPGTDARPAPPTPDEPRPLHGLAAAAPPAAPPGG